MTIKKGAFRVVILTRHYAWKLPSPHYIFSVLSSSPKMLKNGDGKFIFKELWWGIKNFKKGIRENLSEYRCWRHLKAPFLAPTIFSLGLINVQIKQSGPAPTGQETEMLFKKLSKEAARDIAQVEAHCIEAANFVKTNTGFILVDYDDGSTSTANKFPFTVFLEKWNRELFQILIPHIKP